MRTGKWMNCKQSDDLARRSYAIDYCNNGVARLMSKQCFLAVLLMSGGGLLVGSGKVCINRATPYFNIRSQSVDSSRDLIGLVDLVRMYRPDPCECLGVFEVMFEYAQSFNSDSISRCLFGNNSLQNCPHPTIKITGSEVAGRGTQDWFADYFGLPTDFQSIITLKPSIENYIINLSGYWGFDRWCEGLYFIMHAPIVYTKWRLNFNEQVIQAGVNNYEEGYFTDGLLNRDSLLYSFSSFITGDCAPNLDRGLLINRKSTNQTAGITEEFQVTFEPLTCSKWADECCNRMHETGLAEIRCAFGYNIWQCDDYHFGFNARVAAPTGTRPKGEFLFEPIVGNGHHWEVGVGVTGHCTLWCNYDNQRTVNFYFNAHCMHLFGDKQCRAFDLLKNGCNSRYMLALKLDQPVDQLYGHTGDEGVQDGAAMPNNQFKYQFVPVANLSKALVDVSVRMQADVAALLNYTSRCGDWSFDLGYNLWVRSCEIISSDDCISCSRLRGGTEKWAIKGDSYVFGYTTEEFNSCECPNSTIPQETFCAFGDVVPLSSSQSCATIYNGTNNFADPGIRSSRNPGVDNAAFAQTAENIFEADSILDRPADKGDGQQTKISLNPMLLSWADIDIFGAQTKGMSHKIFVHVSYSWDEHDCWFPYFGVGGKAEFAANDGCKQSNKNIVNNNCGRGCRRCALPEWSIWIKGGASFN